MNRAIVLGFVSGCGLLKLCSIFNVVVLFSVSDTNSLVESQLCDIVFSKGLLGALSQFSTAL